MVPTKRSVLYPSVKKKHLRASGPGVFFCCSPELSRHCFPEPARPLSSALTKAGTGTTSRTDRHQWRLPASSTSPIVKAHLSPYQNLSPADRDTVSSLLPVQGDLFEGTPDSLHAAQNYPQFTPPHSERSAIFLPGGAVPLPCCLCRTAYTQNEIALILPTLSRCSVVMHLSVRREGLCKFRAEQTSRYNLPCRTQRSRYRPAPAVSRRPALCPRLIHGLFLGIRGQDRRKRRFPSV